MDTANRTFAFHVEGPLAAHHTVPAPVLVQILENAQRAFDLIGLHVEGKTVKSRARLPKSSVEKFQLICKIPVHGCYAVPMLVGSDASDLFSTADSEAATLIFKRLLTALADRDAKCINNALPDSAIRNRVLESVKGMLPQSGSSWHLDFHDGNDKRFARLTDGYAPFIDELVIPPDVREESQTVTGTLSSVNFTERKLTIIYPVTNREMDCFYPEELEDLLFENRRGLLQVTGRMVLDDSGVPKKITDVSDIRELDLSPFLVTSVTYGELELDANQSLSLVPYLDQSKQLICIDYPQLGIDLFAETRRKLSLELDEQIAMLWLEYARATDDELDEPASKLKIALLRTFHEVKDAA